MAFTPEQKALIESENPEIAYKMEGPEVLAFYILADKMHNKIVRLTDNFWGQTKLGLFTIDELNGKTDLDFSNPDDWTNLTIESIAFSHNRPNMWGSEGTTYHSLLDIRSIELLKQ